MSLLIPKEVGQFFARAEQSLDQVDLTLASIHAATRQIAITAERLEAIASAVEIEVSAFRHMRQRVQGAVGEPPA